MKQTLFLLIVILFSCVDTLPDISGRSVMLVAPTNEVISSDTLVEFRWDPVSHASRYRLFVSDQEESLLLDTVVYVQSFKKYFEPGRYFWQVQAVNGVSITASEIFSFNIDPEFTFPEGWDLELNLLAPLDSTTYQPDTLANFLIWWEPLEEVTYYFLQIVTPSFENPQRIVMERTFYSNEDRLLLSLDSGTYQWRMSAKKYVGVIENGVYVDEYYLSTPFTKPRTLLIRP